jgi:hypothetical protein
MIEAQAKTRGDYHLTYGELIKTLKEAPKGAEFDKRVKGIGSWRGSYIEIALYTEQEGFHAEREEFDGDWDNHRKWSEENTVSGKLPRNANELGELLESLLGLQFVGYKGGNYTIEEWKPLWIEKDNSTCSSLAVVGIDDKLNLITKDVNLI